MPRKSFCVDVYQAIVVSQNLNASSGYRLSNPDFYASMDWTTAPNIVGRYTLPYGNGIAYQSQTLGYSV